MFRKIAQWAFLVFLTLMIVSYAVSAGKSSPVEPQNDEPIGRMYS